jgi:hypothetical protein
LKRFLFKDIRSCEYGRLGKYLHVKNILSELWNGKTLHMHDARIATCILV